MLIQPTLERLSARHTLHPFEMRGRAMDGWLRLDAEGLGSNRQLKRWITRGVTYARSLPPKR